MSERMIYENTKQKICPIEKNCLSRIHHRCGVNRKEINNTVKNPDKIICLAQEYLGNVYEWTPVENSGPLDQITYYEKRKLNISKKEALDIFSK